MQATIQRCETAFSKRHGFTGCTLDSCMQTGVDNPGHPFIFTVGLTAGDEECYEVFKDLFEPVISSMSKL